MTHALLNVKSFVLHISCLHETTQIIVMKEDVHVFASCSILFTVQESTDSITTCIESTQTLVTPRGPLGQLVKKMEGCFVQGIEAASTSCGVEENLMRWRSASVMVSICRGGRLIIR